MPLGKRPRLPIATRSASPESCLQFGQKADASAQSEKFHSLVYPSTSTPSGKRQHYPQCSLGARPKLHDHLAAGASHEIGHHRGDEDRVVDLSCDRDEVRDQVERHGEIRNEQRHGDLRTSWNARIAQQSLEEQNAIRDEARDLTCVASPTEYEQRDHEQQPKRDARADCNCEPEPAAQAATARRSSRSSAIWIALSAAPLRRLSHATNKTSPLSTVSSLRTRPTRTSSVPTASRGRGTSSSRTPGASPNRLRASCGERCSSVSTQAASA